MFTNRNVKCFYIDELGFYRNLDPDQLHYVCSNLNQINRQYIQFSHDPHEVYYKEIRNALGISNFDRMVNHQEWKKDWDDFMRLKLIKNEPATLNKEFRRKVRSGIPHDYRCKVWTAIIRMRTRDIRTRTGENVYQNIIQTMTNKSHLQQDLSPQRHNDLPHNVINTHSDDIEDSIVSITSNAKNKARSTSNNIKNPSDEKLIGFFKQIELDVLRTLPNNCHFENYDSKGIQRVRRVLRAYAYFNQNIGYCQGMNRLAAMSLLVLPEDEAFWCLVTIIHCIMPKDYYLKPWLAQVDCCVLNDFIEIKLPKLHEHLIRNDLQLTLFTWFFTIFVDGFRPELMLRIWDCFLLEGDIVLFRFALTILFISQDDLIRLNDLASINGYLSKIVSTRALDLDQLFESK